ncbi:sensor histidine kinase [Pseudomonadota bacterium]
MRRLYLKIYLSIIVIIATVAVLAPLGWWMFGPATEDVRIYDSLGKLAARALPPMDAPLAMQRRSLRAMADDLDIRLSLYTSDGHHIVSSHKPLPLHDRHRRGWQLERKSGPLITLHLPDNRNLVAAHKKRPKAPFGPLLLLFAFVIFSLGVYVLVRRLTGRLERLQSGVEKLGQGDLSARVSVEGRDEIAELATRFNHTAERIEHLVTTQKNMLATASHELRTPLTRMRMALNLFFENPEASKKEELERNIEELDRLIDEMLLSGKLDASEEMKDPEEVDLLGLLAEEASHYNANVSGEAVVVLGETHLLRRLIRNLLENAHRYGDQSTIDANVLLHHHTALLTICDRGGGVPESERSRIFEPFYRPSHIAEGQHGGVGLGLALVKQIAERHGGSVACLPREGGGSCFEVSLATTSTERTH